MSVIKVLSDDISNRIAAGEVIERPASVVKELVENAIDAGADRVIVKIAKAGSKLVAVTDNGGGMDRDDALLCLEPHATSKITTADDIMAIRSLGFRGEAIPSIASVARFTVRTRRQEDMEGTEVIMEGGKLVANGPCGCAPGTEITVRDLFFNIPARKKFLRSPATEEKHIQECICLLALPYPQVTFELLFDGRRALSSPGHQDLIPRIGDFFGKNLADALLPVDYEHSGVKVTGYTARHGFTRTSRREQRVFVNGRPVEALPVFRGIRDAYGSLVEKGRFPPTVLFIRIDPVLVDVNVHPAKREVRFRQEQIISHAVAEAIRQALHKAAPIPAPAEWNRPSPDEPVVPVKAILDGAVVDYNLKGEDVQSMPMPRFSNRGRFPGPPPPPRPATPELGIDVPEPVQRTSETPEPIPEMPVSFASQVEFPGSGTLTILGFLGDTYILAAAESGLIIIDQHAAHERVLYERILHGSEGQVNSQRLLLPITLELSRTESRFIAKHGNIFEQLGFEAEALSENTVMLNAIPAALSQNNAGGLFRDILSELSDSGELPKNLAPAEVAKAACGAAVKAHDKLSLAEAKSLIRQMSECDLPYSCPHGRPTIINISYKELEKRFGRTK